MKLHLLARRYPSDYQVVTWCGRWISPDRIVVSPQPFGTDAACKTCRKAYAKYRADNEVTSVSLTR